MRLNIKFVDNNFVTIISLFTQRVLHKCPDKILSVAIMVDLRAEVLGDGVSVIIFNMDGGKIVFLCKTNLTLVLKIPA